MEPFRQHRGRVVPLDRANVDTDAIIPKQFLKSVKRTGFGESLFHAWRYLPPSDEHGEHRLNPDFVLNHPHHQGASILLARKNFGCGSSREHAVWALGEAGFRAVIAPSYSEIFFNNCFKNGFLPIVLEENIIEQLFQEVDALRGYELLVDLENRRIETHHGEHISFEINEFHRMCLIEGLDQIGLTLQHRDAIEAYESQRREQAPWLFQGPAEAAK
jgi:3-isopropylmalate/(R)-2-methylmalate dehydratase small subunit